jgi:hypothetical protein
MRAHGGRDRWDDDSVERDVSEATGRHADYAELEAELDDVRAAPADEGTVQLICARPGVDRRVVVDSGELDLDIGLVGDDWRTRGSSSSPDGLSKLDAQLTLMNSRAAQVITGARELWPIAGDQFFVDFDLSVANCPAGTRLALGNAVVEITALPHTGCAKFAQRFGMDALRIVNSEVGRALNLRGVNAKVVAPGVVRSGAVVRKL